LGKQAGLFAPKHVAIPTAIGRVMKKPVSVKEDVARRREEVKNPGKHAPLSPADLLLST
jgi:hypothetical protein